MLIHIYLHTFCYLHVPLFVQKHYINIFTTKMDSTMFLSPCWFIYIVYSNILGPHTHLTTCTFGFNKCKCTSSKYLDIFCRCFLVLYMYIHVYKTAQSIMIKVWMLIGISCHLVYSHLFDISNAWLVDRFFISLYLDVTSTKQWWCQYFLKETARALMFKLTSTRHLMDYKFDTPPIKCTLYMCLNT